MEKIAQETYAICEDCAKKIGLTGEFWVCEPCTVCGNFKPTQFKNFLNKINNEKP